MVKSLRILLGLLLGLPLVSNAYAGHLTVLFEEDAPKDRFIVRNDSTCLISDVSLKIDLAGSKAGLYFDTTASGAGVEVYQPFEVQSGGELLSEIPTIKDGDKVMELKFPELAPESRLVVTIDVDDSLSTTSTPTMISGSEIENATIRASFNSSNNENGNFVQSGYALIIMPDCATA